MSPKKWKNFVLLIFSLGFYTWGEKELVLLILSSAFVDFFAGIIISNGKRKLGLCISILFNLGILFYFKYSDFVYTNLTSLFESYDVSSTSAQYFSNIILPIGISFYTFQTMSYTIDVYRGRVKANRNFIDFATYVTLFPQLVAGPIIRYSHIELELKDRSTSLSQFAEGIERFIIGLTKKVVIANNCAFLVDGVFNLPVSEMSPLIAWLGIFAFGLQLYFDFSGYSDMAIGLGKMFGFNFPENFNYPYTAKSIQEFWRKWHITLSSWFKDYIYIPLGGSRKGTLKTYFNLFVVFFLTGFWHGASWNFIIWGGIHGVFMILERLGFNKILKSINGKIASFYVLFVFFTSLVFFRGNNFKHSIHYLKNMFYSTNKTNFQFLEFYLTKEVFLVLILGVIFSTPIHRNLKAKIDSLDKSLFKFNAITKVKVVFLFFLIFIDFVYISKGSYNPFIYFKF